MRRKLNTWHGYPLSPLAVKSGFIDYYTVAEVTGAEPYDTYASEEGARILKDESKELDVYVLGVCHCGISWRLVCSSIPV